MAEKELGSPAKNVGKIDASRQESPRSSEESMMTASLAMAEKELGSPAKDSISHTEGMVKISKPTIIGSETPSPAKRSKICSISAFEIKEFASPAEKVRMADSSPENTEAIVSPIPGDKTNISPIEASKGIARGERKRKSLSPGKSITLFRSIPRVIHLTGEAEIDIEVSCDLEDNVSPSTSRSSSADYKSDSIKENIKNPVVGESKTETSPKTLERYLRPSERAISISSSRSISGTSSPVSDDDVFAGKYSSDIPSIVATATRDRSCKSESSSADIETDPFSLKLTILKFNTLLGLRDQVVEKMSCSLLSFQNGVQFLRSYVHNVANAVLQIGAPDKEYSTQELKETVNAASVLALKLMNKLKSWKTDVDFDVDTWHKCLQQIQQLKGQYEPLLTNEGEPAITLEVVQVYEYEIKAIWKRMDDMIMIGDSRRALFSQIAHDLEKFMKMFVKCLILVGILQPR
ncbi:hypothetical protein AVEN_52510-1 [Araneus ventricosus]|uniref:Uncharacterized protein n=1 Tax=Araneus ventricosus TaxID=182803 RepID=A0A4Y2AXI3_ARAVE|nr:hypothetical protein AVEN_52510-1 [Araneus ventricosus]